MDPVPTYREFHWFVGEPRLKVRFCVGRRSPDTLMKLFSTWRFADE